VQVGGQAQRHWLHILGCLVLLHDTILLPY
jgi:hypothetical protein